MFYILRTVEVPFAATPPETFVVMRFAEEHGLAEKFALARTNYPGDHLELVETLIGSGGPVALEVGPRRKTIIPPELARAVEAWNAIAERTTPRLAKVKKVEPLIVPYRRWKSRNGNRSYLLEAVVAKVEEAKWTHQFIRFAWLLGQKGGDENAEKILDGRQRFAKPERRAAGNAADFEAVER